MDRSHSSEPHEIVCPSCDARFFLSGDKKAHPAYCTYCGHTLDQTTEYETTLEEVSFVHEHLPDEESVQFNIGSYQVLKRIGKGGMGEVFLAYDTQCGRRIALKRIRSDLKSRKQLLQRFLKEARITAQLTHPSIIPIYSIHEDGQNIYYTMPYVEGETLREIINKARKNEKKGAKPELLGTSIPALTRILVNVCQAISYANSHGVLHRDIKGENIIVGKFGEVMILDWGLAKIMHSQPEDDLYEETKPTTPDITIIGKVVGTISYMAPERARGNPATISTDLYALGVLLYVILTLRHPFRRGNLEEFRKTMHKEVFKEPAELAPYRDVPQLLGQISKKCLAPNPEERYQTVDELIHDLENYIEGRSEWFEVYDLDIHKKNDWQFQEHVLMAEQMAITRTPESSQWVTLMISEKSFADNIRIDARVKIHAEGHGLGFLLSIPEITERRHLNDGYCLWLGTEEHKATKLLRSTVEVLHAPEVFLETGEWHKIRIEKIDNNIYFYLGKTLQFSYISHLPLTGTHVGLIYRDANFELDAFSISLGSQSVMVNCLAVPDSFLAHKFYDIALSEYRRIGYTFPGRQEGREAMFRAGVTLLEQGRYQTDVNKAREYYDLSLTEFEKLHGTPGAPLEYLGKALVYKTIQDISEEVKCYMLAYRRYPSHPLLTVLDEQVAYRMHECSRYHRHATYELVLLVNRHIPTVAKTPHTKKLIETLQRHWESLPFIQNDPCGAHVGKIRNITFSLLLSFWLAKPLFIEELIYSLIKLDNIYPITFFNALYCILELGSVNLVEEIFSKTLETRPEDERKFLTKAFTPFAFAVQTRRTPIDEVLEDFLISLKREINFNEMRILIHLIEKALAEEKTSLVYEVLDRLNISQLDTKQRLRLDYYRIWALLIDKKWSEAGTIFEKYPLEYIGEEKSAFHFLYGCWLHVIEGPEIAKAHFSGVLEVSFPRSWTLATHYINGKFYDGHRWFQQAFMWEKRQLYRQLSLYYHCLGDDQKKDLYHQLAKKQAINDETT